MIDFRSAGSTPTADFLLEALRGRLRLGVSTERYAEAERVVRTKLEGALQGDVDALLTALERDDEIRQTLIETVVVPETHFFRHSDHFVFLRDEVLPGIAGRSGSIRVWSAGCSTGEEAYSLAILLDQAGVAARSQIYATDVCRRALESARAGVYRAWSMRGIDHWPGAGRYFRRTAAGGFRIARSIRDRVSFRELNLADASYPGWCQGGAHFDIVLCRNVLIYMKPEVAAGISRRLIASLAHDGWLIPGPCDPLAGYDPVSQLNVTPWGLFCQRPAVSRGQPAAGHSPGARMAGEKPPKARPMSVTRARARRERSAGPPPVPSAPGRAEDEQAAMRSVPSTPEPPLESIRRRVSALADAGRSRDALRVLEDAAAVSPLCAEAHYLMALMHLHDTAYDEALASLQKLRYLSPSCPVSYHLRGLVLLRQGHREPARRAFAESYRTATALPPDETLPLLEGETASAVARAAQVQMRRLA